MPYKDPEKDRIAKHQYYLKNKERIKDWRQTNKEIINKKRRARISRDRDLYNMKQRQYCARNKQRIQSYYWKNKIQAFKKIQTKLECVRCGCNDIRFLEVNHKNGGAWRVNKITKNEIGPRLWNRVRLDKRKTDDLELLCRPCNHIHFLELKYKEKIPLMVKWNPKTPK